MAIISTDLILRLSGGAANTDPDLALGGIMSTTTAISPTVAEENLFNNIGGTEASVGSTKYRGLYVLNNHGSITLASSAVWIPTQTPSTSTIIAIALAGEGLNATMETVVDENTAPIGESFTSPATFAAGLSTGNVPFGQRYGIWFRRIVTAGATGLDNDDWAFSWQGDTTA